MIILADSNYCDRSSHKIDYFCLAKGCKEKFLCEKCQVKHRKLHNVYIMAIQDLLKFDPKAKLKELTQIDENSSNLQKKMQATFEEVLEAIKIDINNLISKAKEPIKPNLDEGFLSNLNLITDELELLKKQYYESTDQSDDNVRTILFNYAEKYINLQEVLATITGCSEKSTNKFLTFKQLENQKEVLLNKLEESLNSFKQMYFGISSSYEEKKVEVQQKTQQQQKVPEKKPENQEKVSLSTTIIPECDVTQVEKELILKLAAPINFNCIEYIESQNVVVVGDTQGQLQLWEASNFKFLLGEKHHSSSICALQYDIKRDNLYTTSADGIIKVSKVKSLAITSVDKLVGHKQKVWSLLIIDECDLMYSCGKEPFIIGWDLITLKIKQKIGTNRKEVTGKQMAYISQFNLIAVSFKSGTIALYSTNSGQEVHAIDWIGKKLSAMVYNVTREELIVAASKRKLSAWKISNRGFLVERRYQVPGDVPTCIDVVNNGKDLLVASGMDKLTLLDLDTEEYKSSNQVGLGMISSFKINPTVRRIFLSSQDNFITVANF